jgi:hypothetical protein
LYIEQDLITFCDDFFGGKINTNVDQFHELCMIRLIRGIEVSVGKNLSMITCTTQIVGNQKFFCKNLK